MIADQCQGQRYKHSRRQPAGVDFIAQMTRRMTVLVCLILLAYYIRIIAVMINAS
jgi:hypothetical protein